METSKQLFARRRELADGQRALVDEGRVDEARIVEGQIREIDITLDHVLDEEDRMRSGFRSAPAPSRSFGERILGPRDGFRGLEVGFRNDADSDDPDGSQGADAPSVVSVAAPVEIELALPGKSASLLNNFAATLPSAPAAGNISFKRRGAQHGEPGTWEGVKDGESALKPKVIYSWEDAVANKETVAGYVPVSKDTLRDYGELLTIIEGDLLIDLSEKVNAKYLSGNNSSGIVGVQNTPGIQEYTTGAGGAYYDAIRRMRTLVMKNSRRVPTHVCVNPDIKEEIDLYKTTQGLYQFLGDGILWGMTVVEDFDCDGILVYDAYAARKRPIHGTTVEVGYVNDQFVRNELSLLAEQTSALQVVYPDAFVHATKADLDKS